MEPTSSFFRYEHLKPKYRGFSQGFPVAMVTCYVTKMTASCLAIIDVSHGTITLLLRYVIKCCSVNPSNNKVP